jgi:hypothetical protein
MLNHFLPSGRLLMRHGLFEGVERPRELIFCILGIQKSDLDEVEVMFQVGEWSRELIICLLDVLKCDFGEVELTFQGDKRPCELILYLLGNKKTSWTKSRK